MSRCFSVVIAVLLLQPVAASGLELYAAGAAGLSAPANTSIGMRPGGAFALGGAAGLGEGRLLGLELRLQEWREFGMVAAARLHWPLGRRAYAGVAAGADISRFVFICNDCGLPAPEFLSADARLGADLFHVGSWVLRGFGGLGLNYSLRRRSPAFQIAPHIGADIAWSSRRGE